MRIQNNTDPGFFQRAAHQMSEHIVTIGTDAVDVFTGVSNSLAMRGHVNGLSYGLGAYHFVKGVLHGVEALETSQDDTCVHELKMCAGEFLTSTGQFVSANGAAIGLAFLAAGMLITNVETFSHPE